MSKPKDFVGVNNPTAFYHADRVLGGLPQYVKEATVIEAGDLVDLAPTAFADPGRRMFPLHTKAACWLSMAHLLGEGGDPELEAVLEKTAALHGIAEDIAALRGAFAPAKEASDAVAFEPHALEVDFGGEGGLGKTAIYPIGSAGGIVGSAKQMDRDLAEGRLRPHLFRKAAAALVQAAKEHDVTRDDIVNSVWDAGVVRLPDFDTAREVANMRKFAGLGDDDVALYADIVSGAEEEFGKAGSDEEGRACLDKWIELWDKLDAELGVKYARLTPEPHLAFFSGPEDEHIAKLAAEVVLLDGILVPKADLLAVPEAGWVKHLGKSAAAIVIEAQGRAANGDTVGASEILANRIGPEVRRDVLAVLASA